VASGWCLWHPDQETQVSGQCMKTLSLFVVISFSLGPYVNGDLLTSMSAGSSEPLPDFELLTLASARPSRPVSDLKLLTPPCAVAFEP
jgi:hypothetical protein